MLTWVAVYNGNNTLPQYNEDGIESKYTDIDRDKLERFVLIDSETEQVKLVLNLDSSKKLIYRRRTAIDMHSEKKEVVHIVGYQERIGRVTRQGIDFIFESTGHIEVTDGFKEDHRWFYPVRFLPEEEI